MLKINIFNNLLKLGLMLDILLDNVAFLGCFLTSLQTTIL